MTDPAVVEPIRPVNSTSGSSRPGESRDVRPEETARELARLDSHLEGLFRAGHAMLDRVAEPGIVYLVAHCGRELANGVVRALTPDVPELLDGERATVPADARVRINVARVLGERPDHPSVDRWVHVARALQEQAHVRVAGEEGDAPDPEAARAGFLALSDLLYGRLAPFFTAQAELESLAAAPHPTAADLERLRPLLLRPAQRRRFFGELAHAGWLLLLRDGGFLNAPSLVTGSDGQRRARYWVEGRYLERVAPDAPVLVREVLAAIPHANDNPIVWRTVADAAGAMPPGDAGPLVARLLRAIRTPPIAAWCAHALVTLAEHLAAARADEGFTLADALLWLVRQPPAPAASEPSAPDAGEAPHITGLRRLARRRTQNTEWMLERLDAFEFTRFIERVVPPLEQADGLRTLALLAQKLAHAVRLGVTADAEDDARESHDERRDSSDEGAVSDGSGLTTTSAANEAQTSAASRPRSPAVAGTSSGGISDAVFGGTAADDSQHWAERLDRPDPHAGVRYALATTIATIAQRLAATGPEAVDAVDSVLRAHRWDVFARIRLVVLANVGDNAPTALVDAVLDSPDVVALPYLAREVAAFLRAQFTRASTDAQARYATRLRDGPPADELAVRVESERWWRTQGRTEREQTAVPNDAALAVEVRQDWQRRRLQFFHATIPPVLRDLADALGVVSRVPTPREQALNEVGTWSSGVQSRGWRSPLKTSELVELPPDAVLARLAEWPATAEEGSDGRWDVDAPLTASRTGLLRALADAVGAAPTWAAELAAHMAARLEADEPWAAAGDAAAHVAALLHGLEFRDGALTPASWPGVRDLVRAVWRQSSPEQESENDITAEQESDDDAGRAPWQEPARAAVDVLRRFVERELVPIGEEGAVWDCLTSAVQCRGLWAAPLHARPARLPTRADGERSATGENSESAVALGRLADHAEQAPAGRLFRATVACADWHLYVADAPEHEAAQALNPAPASRRARRGRGRGDSTPSAERRQRVAARARVVLTQWFRAAVDAGDHSAAEYLLGTELAFLHWLVRRWVRRQVLPRMGDGATPVSTPAWGGYITRGQVTRSLFKHLPGHYLVAAASDADRPRRADAQFDRIGTGLATHVVNAALIGAVGLRHPSDVVARVFRGVDARDRDRVYWQYFRAVSDTPGGPSPRYARRLLAFWGWRVHTLESEVAGTDLDRRAAASAEAAEMLWLLATPGLEPVETVLALGARTARLVRSSRRGVGAVWARLGPLAAAWPAETFEILECLVGPELRDGVPYLPDEPVSAILRGALRGTPDVRARARRLIDRLGEHDDFSFRPLLAELGA